MERKIKNFKTVKSHDSLFTEMSELDILSIILGEGDPAGPIILPPQLPK